MTAAQLMSVLFAVWITISLGRIIYYLIDEYRDPRRNLDKMWWGSVVLVAVGMAYVLFVATWVSLA